MVSEATEGNGGEDGSYPGLCFSLVKTGVGGGGGVGGVDEGWEALATLL